LKGEDSKEARNIYDENLQWQDKKSLLVERDYCGIGWMY
jgi:hypothetical protein